MTAIIPAPAGPAAAHHRAGLIRARGAATLARRRRVGAAAAVLCGSAVVVALVPLGSLIAYTVAKGLHALSVGFLAHTPRPSGVPGGGIANALVGTAVIDGLALVMAVPMGLLVAIHLIEGGGRIRAGVRFGADVLAGLPSIVIGLFAYIVVVAPLRHFSALSASFALAVLMLPVMIRADEEALRSVPDPLWEAGLALGAAQPRVVRSVVVRTALPGLVTANLLALARAVGETAPLLFTAIGSQLFTLSPTQPMASMPLVIFQDGTQPFADTQTTAWGTAFVLLVAVLVLSIAGRAVAGRLTQRAR
ncbi:MAG TPA: phosphate ABC transporter permease PstA [Acidimicrobiales bacterium]|nr:phosphate ABC transporter permease PstA [Acidimicrobiales bacterium]